MYLVALVLILKMNTELIFLIALIVVSATILLIIRNFMINEQNKRTSELRMVKKEKTLLMQLQAYERLLVLLERLRPEKLISRNLGSTSKSKTAFQKKLLQNINQEFEHNFSQQLYISSQAWQLVQSAKEDLLKCIHVSASEFKEEVSALEYGNSIIKNFANQEKNTLKLSIEYIKQEARQLL